MIGEHPISLSEKQVACTQLRESTLYVSRHACRSVATGPDTVMGLTHLISQAAEHVDLFDWKVPPPLILGARKLHLKTTCTLLRR